MNNYYQAKPKAIITRFQELTYKQKILRIACNKATDSVMLSILLKKLYEINTMKWELTFEEAEQNKNIHYENKCKSIGITIKVLGGNEKGTLKAVYDLKTGKELSWQELIERSKAK